MSVHQNMKRRRSKKKKRQKGGYKIYLIIILICFLVAAAISFMTREAPDLVKKMVVKNIADKAKEMGMEGMDENKVNDLMQKYEKYQKIK